MLRAHHLVSALLLKLDHLAFYVIEVPQAQNLLRGEDARLLALERGLALLLLALGSVFACLGVEADVVRKLGSGDVNTAVGVSSHATHMLIACKSGVVVSLRALGRVAVPVPDGVPLVFFALDNEVVHL